VSFDNPRGAVYKSDVFFPVTFSTRFQNDMTKIALIFSLLVLCASFAVAAQPETMRVDYYHTGDLTSEVFSLDRVVIEPLPWPGNLAQSIDKTGYGKYFFEVRDQKTKNVMYSRGFSSIYGEWETTDEAKNMTRTFQESFRFPAPTSTVEIVLKKRDTKNVFHDVWTTTVDPQDQFVDRVEADSARPLF
jgi:hypothetical protein